MKVFVAALMLIGLCVLGMCVGILFHKGFPQYDVGSNEEMKKRGITCYKDEDARLQHEDGQGKGAAQCSGVYSDSCKGCSLYGLENVKSK